MRWRRSLSIHPPTKLRFRCICSGVLAARVHRSVAEVEAGLCGEEDATGLVRS